MSENLLDDVDLKTPKTVRSRISATSTAVREQKRLDSKTLESQLENSLGLLSLNNIDLSNIIDISSGRSSIDHILDQQRQLASNTLSRASKVTAIPSKLLQRELLQTKSETNLCLEFDESTVSESDLLQTPKNTSTPRSSELDFDFKKPATPKPRESIFSVFREMLDSNVSTHNAAEEFRQISQAGKTTIINPGDSGLFIPAEDAASQLLADELSWKKKYDVPVIDNLNSFQDTKDQSIPSMSIGEFFKERSDNISQLRAASPHSSKPLALIDSSEVEKQNESTFQSIDSSKSLSISAIQKVLSEADSPKKLMNYLFNKNKNKMVSQSVSENEGNISSSNTVSLPVSRDTSYTSSYSDNEAIRVVVREEKENIKPSNNKRVSTEVISRQPLPQNVLSPDDLRVLSTRSSSCLTSLPNGKLPIESTVSELVWGCVKVDRCVTKEFMVRNKTPKTLRLQCSLSSHEFKIRKDARSDSDPLSACKFILHGNESRSLIISYIPTKIGAAVDELVFAPLDTSLTQTKKQCIRLWGYGGYSNIEYHNAIRDNTGKYWLSLGRMDNRISMECSFTIKNTGNVPSFTLIKVMPKHIVTFSNLKVEPELFVLLPNEEKNIKITYIPNAKDCRILKQNLNVLPVVDIGKLEIVSGPEVTRARLKRLYRKSVEKGLSVSPKIQVLKEKIVGEIFPSDITRFKESPNAIPELMETLSNDEIAITIEQDPNQTLVAEYPEDSVIFQSLCQDATAFLNETALSQSSCRLEPPSIVLLPPSKIEDTLFLISETTKTLHYEISCSPGDLLITPTDGILSPGDTAKFKVKLPKNVQGASFKVLVYVENEVFESLVKVLPVRSLKKNFLE